MWGTRGWVLVSFLVALLGLSGAAAGATPRKPLVINFTKLTSSKKGTKSCPNGTVNVTGRSAAGAAADGKICELGSKTTRKKPLTKAITSGVTITLAGTSGKLEVLVRIIQVSKGTTARRTVTGIIYPGTGAFAKAAGRVFGTGKISFPKNRPPSIDITFRFAFD